MENREITKIFDDTLAMEEGKISYAFRRPMMNAARVQSSPPIRRPPASTTTHAICIFH